MDCEGSAQLGSMSTSCERQGFCIGSVRTSAFCTRKSAHLTSALPDTRSQLLDVWR